MSHYRLRQRRLSFLLVAPLSLLFCLPAYSQSVPLPLRLGYTTREMAPAQNDVKNIGTKGGQARTSPTAIPEKKLLAQQGAPADNQPSSDASNADVKLRGIEPPAPPSTESWNSAPQPVAPQTDPPSTPAPQPVQTGSPVISPAAAPATSTSTSPTPTELLQGAAPSTSMEPVTIKSAELLRRYLYQLAQRHNLQPPAQTDVTRAQLGQYFLKLMPNLAGLPADQLSRQDLYEIGMLTDEFQDALWQVKGTMALRAFKAPLAESEEMSKKMAEASSRLAALEKLKINGDFTFVPQSDMGRQDRDSMTANLRARINFLARVHEAKAGERLGDGYLFASGTFLSAQQVSAQPIQ